MLFWIFFFLFLCKFFHKVFFVFYIYTHTHMYMSAHLSWRPAAASWPPPAPLPLWPWWLERIPHGWRWFCWRRRWLSHHTPSPASACVPDRRQMRSPQHDSAVLPARRFQVNMQLQFPLHFTFLSSLDLPSLWRPKSSGRSSAAWCRPCRCMRMLAQSSGLERRTTPSLLSGPESSPVKTHRMCPNQCLTSELHSTQKPHSLDKKKILEWFWENALNNISLNTNLFIYSDHHQLQRNWNYSSWGPRKNIIHVSFFSVTSIQSRSTTNLVMYLWFLCTRRNIIYQAKGWLSTNISG